MIVLCRLCGGVLIIFGLCMMSVIRMFGSMNVLVIVNMVFYGMWLDRISVSELGISVVSLYVFMCIVLLRFCLVLCSSLWWYVLIMMLVFVLKNVMSVVSVVIV